MILSVDHTFVYTGAVRKIRELVRAQLGELLLPIRSGVNLGLFQHDVNVIWESRRARSGHHGPRAAVAADRGLGHGDSHVGNEPTTSVPHAVLQDRLIAHLHVTGLAPVKVAPHAHRPAAEDDRLRRFRDQREDQGLRQGVTVNGQWQRERHSRTAC